MKSAIRPAILLSAVAYAGIASAQTPPPKPAAAAAPATSAPAAAPAAVPAPATPTPAPAAAEATAAATVQAPAAEAGVTPEPTDADEKKKKKKKKGKKQDAEDDADDGEATDSGEADMGVEGNPWEGMPRGMRALGLSFRFLLQARYRHTFAADSTNVDPVYREAEREIARDGDGWDINRGFFGVSAEPSKYLGIKMVLDVAELRHNKPKKVVKQFYADIRPIPKHFHIAAGIIKLPYSIHELDPIARYEFTSSGAANALISDLGFGGRDLGAEVIVSPLSKPRYLTLTAGLFRAHANDENASPIGAIAARVETTPIDGLRLGAGIVSQPNKVVDLNALSTSGKDLLPNPENPSYPRSRTWEKGNAFGADVTYQQGPIRLRVEGLLGDRVDYDFRYGATQWADVWATVAYRFDVGDIGLEPALRAEFYDSDFKRDSGLYKDFSFALGTHFNRSTKLVVDVTRIDVQANTPVTDQPLPLREIPFNALSLTRVAAQLQVAL
ncbi:MAG: hypothetical protein QM756_09730 [Polyangiaceae bacterium]